MKKLSIFAALLSLIAISTGCSDGKSESHTWQANDSCAQKDLSNNGTQCQGKSVIRCENGKISVQSCNEACIIENNVAVCKTESSSTTTKPSRTEPEPNPGTGDTRPGSGNDPDNPRPGTNNTTDPAKEPNNGDACGQYDSKGTCNVQTGTVILCDPGTNKIKKTTCAAGCLLDNEKHAICIEPCGDVPETGICAKENDRDVLKYCYKAGNKESLMIEECKFGCGMVDDANTCLTESTSTPEKEECGVYAEYSSCNYQKKTITYCDDDHLVHEPCDHGCMYDNDLNAVCIVPCNGIDENGVCGEDNVLQYCYSDNTTSTLITVDCKDYDKVCGDDNGAKNCIKPNITTTDDCGDIDEDGTCTQDNVLKYCKTKNGTKTLITVDCKLDEQVCAYDDAQGYYDCLATCGSIDEDGICTKDNVLKYCRITNDSQILVTRDCKESNKICGDKDGYKDCIEQNYTPADACGDITEAGVCLSTTEVAYCDNGKLATYSCELQCVEPEGRDADCYDYCGSITEKGKCLDSKTLAYCDPDYGYIEKDCSKSGKKCTKSGDYSNCK